jgi:hypothetical protein
MERRNRIKAIEIAYKEKITLDEDKNDEIV